MSSSRGRSVRGRTAAGGYRQGLVMKPDILLADEPTGNLDEKNADGIHSLISELNKELGMTVIVVTHNMKLAHMMEEKVTIQRGKIVPAHERD